MAQHIGCQLIDENGNVITDFGLNFALVLNIIGEKDTFQWLNTINAYGDTVFNPLQIPYVVAELEKLKSQVDDKTQQLIAEFILHIKTVGVHQYIKFIGD